MDVLKPGLFALAMQILCEVFLSTSGSPLPFGVSCFVHLIMLLYKVYYHQTFLSTLFFPVQHFYPKTQNPRLPYQVSGDSRSLDGSCSLGQSPLYHSLPMEILRVSRVDGRQTSAGALNPHCFVICPAIVCNIVKLPVVATLNLRRLLLCLISANKVPT